MTSSGLGAEHARVVSSTLAAVAPPAARSWVATLASWRERHWSALAAAIAIAVTIVAFEPFPVGVWVDDGHYVILARALASGDGYRYVNLPGAPFATHFPPGYPVFLAVLTRLVPAFPANVRLFVFANAVFTATTAAAIVVLGHRRLSLPLPVATLAAVSWAIAVPTLMLSTAVMSEPFFLALLLPTLLLAERAARDGRARATVVVALMLAACFLVRSIGVAACGALIVVLAARRRWRDLGLTVVTTGAAIAPWLVWKRLHETPLPTAWAGMYGDYGTWFADGLSSHGITLVSRVATQNSRDIIEAFAGYWSAGPGGAFRTSLGVVLLVATCAGLAICWRRAPVSVGTLVGYIAIVLVWPFDPQRFVWGVGALWIPFACAAAWRLWEWLAGHVVSRTKRAACSAALTAFALCMPIGLILAVPTRAWNRVPRQGEEMLVPMLQWVARNTSPDAIIATDAETVVYLYTGRRGVPYVPFKASDRVGLMTADEAYAGLGEILRLYHPRWVLATALPTLRVGTYFTTHEGGPLRLILVPKYGAVFEAHELPAGAAGAAADVPISR